MKLVVLIMVALALLTYVFLFIIAIGHTNYKRRNQIDNVSDSDHQDWFYISRTDNMIKCNRDFGYKYKTNRQPKTSHKSIRSRP